MTHREIATYVLSLPSVSDSGHTLDELYVLVARMVPTKADRIRCMTLALEMVSD